MDLAGLPCEGDKQFFYPLEFDKRGTLLYDSQMAPLMQRLKEDDNLRDVYVIVHGWDKTAQTAEADYQNFICRFHEQGIREQWAYGKEWADMRHAVLIGIFWPSTIFPNLEDPAIIKPLSYFYIRERADLLQETGLRKVFGTLIDLNSLSSNRWRKRLHFIGHSFGGRIIVNGLLTLLRETSGGVRTAMESYEAINIVLLLPALSASSLDEVFSMSKRVPNVRTPGWLVLRQYREKIGVIPSMHMYIVYSRNDWANRFLFRFGGLIGDDGIECAAGACGVNHAKQATVDEAGQIHLDDEDAFTMQYDNIWNVDASEIISSHGDIFKGRVAQVIWKLLRQPLHIRRWYSLSPMLLPPGE